MGRFRGGQRRPRPSGGLRAHLNGDGRVQRVGWHLEPIGAEQAVLWSKPTRGQRGRQGLLRVQGRCEGRALSEDGGQRARQYLCFLKPVGSYVLVTSESFLPVWRPRALARCAPVKYFRVVRQRYTIQNLAAALR